MAARCWRGTSRASLSPANMCSNRVPRSSLALQRPPMLLETACRACRRREVRHRSLTSVAGPRRKATTGLAHHDISATPTRKPTGHSTKLSTLVKFGRADVCVSPRDDGLSCALLRTSTGRPGDWPTKSGNPAGPCVSWPVPLMAPWRNAPDRQHAALVAAGGPQ